jgi:hypothetical protein
MQNVARRSHRAPAGRRWWAGLGFIEVLVGATLTLIVFGIAYGLMRFSRVSTEQTIGPNLGLQSASRVALLKLIKELQECIEFVRPRQGASLNYFIARDKLNQILTGYIARNDDASDRAGRDIFDLHLHRHDVGKARPPSRHTRLLPGIERLSFTALSSGVIQIHMTLHEQGKSYTLLTTVRARNVLMEGEL